MTDLPTLAISPAARPTPSTATRAPEASNSVKPGQEDDAQFHEELTREMHAQQGQTAPAGDARASTGPSEHGNGEDGPKAGQESADASAASIAAMLNGTAALPATIINALPLPAAVETGVIAANGSAADATSMGIAGNARGAHPKWPGPAGTDPHRPDSLSALADSNAEGMERAAEKSRAEYGLAATAALAESAAAGKFLSAARDALNPVAALESRLTPAAAAETPLSAAMNAGAAAPTQGAHVAAATAAIAAHVAAPGWDRAVGEKVVWMAGQHLQVAELHLNPPELGPLQITLTVNNDLASAQFVSQHAAVRDAIEAAMPRLREMLAEGGITLGNANVSAESFREQAQQDSRNHAARGAAQAETGGAFRVTQSMRTLRGLVDIFA